MTRRRSTPFLKEVINEYLRTGITPELTIQGIMDDKGSDYVNDYGTDIVTVTGCVLTGDLPLTALDSAGEVVDDVIGFNAKDVIM